MYKYVEREKERINFAALLDDGGGLHPHRHPLQQPSLLECRWDWMRTWMPSLCSCTYSIHSSGCTHTHGLIIYMYINVYNIIIYNEKNVVRKVLSEILQHTNLFYLKLITWKPSNRKLCEWWWRLKGKNAFFFIKFLSEKRVWKISTRTVFLLQFSTFRSALNCFKISCGW